MADDYAALNNDDFPSSGDIFNSSAPESSNSTAVNNNNNNTSTFTANPAKGALTSSNKPVAPNSEYQKLEKVIGEIEHDIALAQWEKKENDELLTTYFDDLMKGITSHKEFVLNECNEYYEKQKQESTNVLSEFRKKLDAMPSEAKEDATMRIMGSQQSQFSKQANNKKSFKNLFKRKSSKFNEDEMKEAMKEKYEVPQRQKLKIFFPTKELIESVNNSVSVTSEWWSPLKIDCKHWNIRDAEINRITEGGWLNAFGTTKIRKNDKKRWNLKIIGGETVNSKQPADLVIGVMDVESNVETSKKLGFWDKKYGGYGFYCWSGKLFHNMTKGGKPYSTKVSVGSVIGIELDLTTNGKEGVLRFYVNDQVLGDAFSDIDRSKEYSLAIAMNSPDYFLKLLM